MKRLFGSITFALLSGPAFFAPPWATSLVAADPDTASVRTVVATTQSAAVSRYLVALPHIAYGAGWRTKIIVTNTSSVSASLTLSYFSDAGTPLGLPFGGTTADHTDLTIPGLGQREVEPDWNGSGGGGWAALVYTNAGLRIQGVFLWHNPADPADKYTEAAAPIIAAGGVSCIVPLPGNASYTMPYDQTEGRFSGYGFANTTNASVALTVAFYNQEGTQIGAYTEPVPAFGHTQFLVAEKLPGASEKKGLMTITGDGIAPLGFRFTPYYTFTTWQP